MLTEFFQFSPLPYDQIHGTYSFRLVIISYLVAVGASYVALDIANRVREIGISLFNRILWILGGAFAMGAGIWSMHFIGMLAFVMPMSMTYDPYLTFLSMFIAVIASGIAFSLLQSKRIKKNALILGGVILGLSIASMHYVGMSAMSGMNIRYQPGLFLLSIGVALIASEVALYLALKSSEINSSTLKIGSAFIMGAAIAGMHYVGMAAAVMTPFHDHQHAMSDVNPNTLAIGVAIATILILGIAVILSSIQAKLYANSVEMARKAGMAEVASNVLHNVGNALNSVNVSCSLITEHLKNINLHHLHDLNNLMNDHQHDLGEFITVDPQGSNIPAFLTKMAEHWTQEFQSANRELKQLEHSIQHIKHIIAAQQKLSGVNNFEELVSIESVIDESLTIVSVNFDRDHIVVQKNYTPFNPIYIDKSKLTQILINLIENAKQSMLAADNAEKILIINTGFHKEDRLYIEVNDTGLGINPQHLTKIFSHGFTTKKEGHGFGLHASAIAMGEMAGILKVRSEGEGRGATFKIIFPYKTDKNYPLERMQEKHE